MTITLTSFLLARIEDDEATARAAAGWRRDGRTRSTGRWDRYGIASLDDDEGQVVIHSDNGQVSASVAAHIARHDPARVLAECEAKQAIVALHVAYPTPQRMVYGMITACSECGSVDDSPVAWPCPTLRILAAPYSDHPDYDDSWRP